MTTIHKPKNKKQQEKKIEGEITKCPKCDSKNILTIGKRGDRTLSCLDCDYTEGIGTE